MDIAGSARILSAQVVKNQHLPYYLGIWQAIGLGVVIVGNFDIVVQAQNLPQRGDLFVAQRRAVGRHDCAEEEQLMAGPLMVVVSLMGRRSWPTWTGSSEDTEPVSLHTNCGGERASLELHAPNVRWQKLEKVPFLCMYAWECGLRKTVLSCSPNYLGTYELNPCLGT